MPRDTPSMAKNKIKRSLNAILDPHPSKSDENLLWEYFESACAYCGRTLERKARIGHLDHVLPAAAGGTNSIFNHVLSCAICNGDEKREEDWLVFLNRKAEGLEYGDRKSRIENWLERAPDTSVAKRKLKEAEPIIAEALTSFEDAVERIRRIRDDGT